MWCSSQSDYNSCINTSGCLWYNLDPSTGNETSTSFAKCISPLNLTQLSELSFTAVQTPIDKNISNVYIYTIYNGSVPIQNYPIISHINVVIAYNSDISATNSYYIPTIPTITTTPTTTPKSSNLVSPQASTPISTMYNYAPLSQQSLGGVTLPKSLSSIVNTGLNTCTQKNLTQLIQFSIPSSQYNSTNTNTIPFIPSIMKFDFSPLSVCLNDTSQINNITISTIQFFDSMGNSTPLIQVKQAGQGVIDPIAVQSQIVSKLNAIMPNLNATSQNIQTLFSISRQ